ncbi:hypothetical protein E2C01_020336 [Portunus trituberculatus]|uniref:Uncharacterized protein n=1 Tax=Portunus trituberculatus TaxID=210409 RepID=A0A5B7E188_PORTR|nr:hypothetical protein [Portunus trituberculatus]
MDCEQLQHYSTLLSCHVDNCTLQSLVVWCKAAHLMGKLPTAEVICSIRFQIYFNLPMVSITSDALQNISQVNLTPHCGTPTTAVTSQ